ncbi:MAG TPA: indole-3-glycerol phosphate synthase TrpC [Pyrinomonadaceae bacterium]|mgnify:CR=1 FL=1|nr:indole-3-glycerol phosphate synthase TrpC [Pyrinomonadaceae bacterium]
MNETILDKIIEAKLARIAEAKKRIGPVRLVETAASCSQHKRTRFRDALARKDRLNIIAEFKRASPSKGVINDRLDPVETAVAYENGGAAAISVLTEEDHFDGSIDDLKAVRGSVALPLLRKDFIVDEYQIYESALAGADAVLLIASALTSESLESFQRLAASLGMDAIVEVHDHDELEKAADIGAHIIGVNNRNLKTFEVTLDVSRELIRHRPEGTLMIAESGLSSHEDLSEFHKLGFDGFLVGETLMKTSDQAEALRALL